MADGFNFVAFTPGPGLAEQITTYVEQQIINGSFKSGDRVQESRIVRDLGVSRGSVREAFRLLERKRLLCIVPRRGAVVAKLSPARVSDLNTLVLLMVSAVVRDVVPDWSEKHGERFQKALIDSKSQFGVVNPLCAFRSLCEIHANAAYPEFLADLTPTLDRLFAKLVRTDRVRVEALEHMVLSDLTKALAERSVETCQRVIHLLCRGLERKYLETLERTG